MVWYMVSWGWSFWGSTKWENLKSGVTYRGQGRLAATETQTATWAREPFLHKDNSY